MYVKVLFNRKMFIYLNISTFMSVLPASVRPSSRPEAPRAPQTPRTPGHPKHPGHPWHPVVSLSPSWVFSHVQCYPLPPLPRGARQYPRSRYFLVFQYSKGFIQKFSSFQSSNNLNTDTLKKLYFTFVDSYLNCMSCQNTI